MPAAIRYWVGMPGAGGRFRGEWGPVPPGLGLPAWIFAPATFELGAAPPTLVADSIGRGAVVAEFGEAFVRVAMEPGRVAAALGPVLGTGAPPEGAVVLVVEVVACCAKTEPDANRPIAVAAPMCRSLIPSSPGPPLRQPRWHRSTTPVAHRSLGARRGRPDAGRAKSVQCAALAPRLAP